MYGDSNLILYAGNYIPNPFEIITKPKECVVSEYTTLRSYPNPFNPTTTLSYQLPEAGRVHLAIYDISGRQVADLIDGWREAGSHGVTFDASNLPSGIYIARLQAGNVSTSQKLVLVK